MSSQLQLLLARRAGRREVLRLLAGLPLAAQELPRFSTEVKVVSVLATVRDRSGELVGNLTRDDFVLVEEGRPQEIRYFSAETNLPLTLGLMVDTSYSQRKVMDAERGASMRFLDQVVRPDRDKVFLLQFDSAIRVVQPLTASVGKLEDTLGYVDTEPMSTLRAHGGGGTLLFDAVVQASDDIMKKLTGRKALIVLTDGEDYGSSAVLQDATDSAQTTETLVYSIFYSAYGGRGRRVLEQLSDATGGSFFAVSRKQTLDQIFAVLQEELRTQYSIGYVSDTPVSYSRFRKIELTVRRKGLSVQARKQYWARP